MILDKIIEIKIANANAKHYRSKGYVCTVGDLMKVKIEDVPKCSNRIVRVICDICESPKELSINAYWMSYNCSDYNFYSCGKCSIEKRKKTCTKKYGCENPMQNIEVKEKVRQTNIIRYGVDNVLQSKVVKDKVKNTCIERYGCENPMQNKEIQEKVKLTNIERYGFDNPSKCIDIQNKITQTMLSRYGIEYPMQLEEFKECFKKSMLENHGVEYTLQLDIFKDRLREIKIETSQWSDNIEEYQKYKNKVHTLTNRIRKELFTQWNGYDFYDNEYIKHNLDENCYSPNYPSVDHKISVLYGYQNNITPEEISHIDNLCITKRGINSSKGAKCSDEYSNLNRFS